MNKILEENILENHINFLAKHRGVKECTNYGQLIHSDKEEYNIGFPISQEGLEKISKKYTIYLPQWVLIDEQTKLKYKKLGSLTYMVLSNKRTKWETNKKIITKRASSLSDIEDFSIVQGKAFCETEEVTNSCKKIIKIYKTL